MPQVKFIHTADLHLDTPFKGLSQINKQLAVKIKDATLKAFESIIDKCISERVDFLLIAGDIFDRESQSLGSQIKFVEQLQRLSNKGIFTYFICGNHDPLCSWMNNLDLPENVFRFSSSEVERLTYSKEGTHLADIYGISYQDKALTENISLKYKLSENRSPFSIALLHGNLAGNAAHGNYAPCTIADLENSQFDYWALGHIHSTQIVKMAEPAIVYPGNPQGRDFGERGQKGCFLVELKTSQIPRLSLIPTQLIRFEQIEIDLTDVTNNSELTDRITIGIENIPDLNEEDSAIIRLTLKGRTSMHLILSENSESLLENLNEGILNSQSFKFIDRIKVDTQPEINLDELKNGNDFIAEILKEIDDVFLNEDKKKQLLESLSNEMIGSQLKKELKHINEDDKAEILNKAKFVLLDKLLTE